MAGRSLSAMVLLAVCMWGVFVTVQTSDDLIVKVQQGFLRGKSFTSIRSKNKFFGFLGIPYAKPPVGELRFKAPEAPEGWTGTRDAKKEGSVCTQRNDFTRLLVGDDDCLFLNVYTPKLPTENDKSLLPVMFFIHGGAFYFGSGGSNVYGPDYLVDQGVLLVTINYRLGPQGFLSLQNSETPGNAGLKDQVMALRWVQQNIAQFGGDPRNVTIFGQSAGGASVQYHMLSPMSKGLFHRAISQSGSVLNVWAFTNSSRNMAFRLGEKLGFETKDPHDLVKFLRSVNTLNLTKASHEVLTLEEKPMAFGYPFLPTVEYESGGEVFLSAHPRTLLDAGELNAVPLIAGVTSHEGILAINILNEHEDAFEILDKEFERAIPMDVPVARHTDEARNIANKIRKFYFGNKRISEDTITYFINMITDEWFVKDVNAAVEKIAASSEYPVYFYQFSFEGAFGIFKRLLGAENIPGVAHAEDLGYLFNMLLTSRTGLSDNDPSVVTLFRMVKMWTNFAKSGNPTPGDDSLLNVTWTPFITDKHSYLNIDKEVSLEQDLNKDRIQFWKDLYNSIFV